MALLAQKVVVRIFPMNVTSLRLSNSLAVVQTEAEVDV